MKHIFLFFYLFLTCLSVSIAQDSSPCNISITLRSNSEIQMNANKTITLNFSFLVSTYAARDYTYDIESIEVFDNQQNRSKAKSYTGERTHLRQGGHVLNWDYKKDWDELGDISRIVINLKCDATSAEIESKRIQEANDERRRRAEALAEIQKQEDKKNNKTEKWLDHNENRKLSKYRPGRYWKPAGHFQFLIGVECGKQIIPVSYSYEHYTVTYLNYQKQSTIFSNNLYKYLAFSTLKLGLSYSPILCENITTTFYATGRYGVGFFTDDDEENFEMLHTVGFKLATGSRPIKFLCDASFNYHSFRHSYNSGDKPLGVNNIAGENWYEYENTSYAFSPYTYTRFSAGLRFFSYGSGVTLDISGLWMSLPQADPITGLQLALWAHSGVHLTMEMGVQDSRVISINGAYTGKYAYIMGGLGIPIDYFGEGR